MPKFARPRFAIFIFVICSFVVVSPHARSSASEYVGRYTDGRDYAVYFEESAYGLTIRPVMWTATQLLKPLGNDKFVVIDRTSRGADFRRDEKGQVSGVSIRGMDGEGLTLTRSEAPMLPVELFLAGHTAEALRGYTARGSEGVAKALEIAEQVLHRLPTKSQSVVQFLVQLEPYVRWDPAFHTLLGYAYVQAGKRGPAMDSFRRAYSLDPANKEAISGLARLGHLPPDAPKSKEQWTIPFPLSAVFAKPTSAEIRAVEADWAERDLSPSGIRDETTGTVAIGDWTANVRIVSHRVHGSRHYGAIIIPKGAATGCCPVIIEAKGVSPTYFPLTLENLSSPPMMGDLRDRFIYVVPTYRGEVLNFNGATYRSEGDRRDALDGATDDTIALLNVVLKTTPQADPERICAFGRSRGGTVALLTGIRDPRVTCVVNWSGPTDWFYLMGTEGWTEQELWAEGLRTHATPLETGGQNIERFLSKALEGSADLAAVRHNMIASSPLYFAKRLPLSQNHYGLEDPSVPSRNGRELIAELRHSGVPPGRYTVFFYPD